MGNLLVHDLKTWFFHPVSYFIGVTGLILGSFFNVCIHRIPLGTFFSSQRSRCPHCGSLIPSWLNIPVLSYILLRGTSRCCSKPISARYPVVEILTAVLLLTVYWSDPFILSLKPLKVHPVSLVRFLHLGAFTSLMVICSFIDMQHRIIPDKISLPMIAVSPVWIWLHPELDWKSSAIGVVAGLGVIYVISWIYYLLKRGPGIGLGDAKLLGAIGGWLGYQALFPTMFYGSILGSAYGLGAMIVSGKINLKSEIPFGPFLATGALLHMLLSMRIQELLLIR